MPADMMIVTSRKTIARPDTSSGRSGRISLTTRATSEGSTNAQAIHIAASRAKLAQPFSLSGNDLVSGVEEQRRELEVELGIEAEDDADHEPQRQGDEKSSPVHGARFSGAAEGMETATVFRTARRPTISDSRPGPSDHPGMRRNYRASGRDCDGNGGGGARAVDAPGAGVAAGDQPVDHAGDDAGAGHDLQMAPHDAFELERVGVKGNEAEIAGEPDEAAANGISDARCGCRALR